MHRFSLNQTKGSFRINKLFFIFSFVLGTLFLASVFLWNGQPEVISYVISKNKFVSPQPNLRLNSKPQTERTHRRTRTDAEIDSERRSLRSKERFNLMEEEKRDRAAKGSEETNCTIGMLFKHFF